MRTRRLKLSEGEAYYHCISRTVAGAFLFDDRDKEHFRLLMHRVAGFCGLEIIAYALMSNHFHILVRVPDPCETQPSDRELIHRLGLLYSARPAWVGEQAMVLAKGGGEADWLRRQLRSRMGDVSAFMKELKQLYSRWYNIQHQRFGTLWAERFKSVLVEGNPRVLRMMAAYIDLNPVRAGLCDDPADYRFCSYAEATAGEGAIRKGFARLFEADRWAQIRQRYRCYLFQTAARSGRSGGKSLSQEKVEFVLAQGGEMDLPTLLRKRLRFLVEGKILGSELFIQQQVQSGSWVLGRKRTPRARAVLRPIVASARDDQNVFLVGRQSLKGRHPADAPQASTSVGLAVLCQSRRVT